MRVIGRIAKWTVLGLLAAVVIVGGYTWFRVRAALPQAGGTIRVAGPSAAIEVIRDGWGIPHVRASSEHDAAFGLGYVHAQDRLWQMEFQRRLAAGRLSEILGPAALETDRLFRTLGVRRAAVAATGLLPPEARAYLDAYVRGVNAFLTTHSGRGLPVEYAILQVTPEPYTAEDAVAWSKVMALSLSTNYRDEMLRSRIAGKVGLDGARALMPAYTAGGPVILPEGLAPTGAEPAAAVDLSQHLVDTVARLARQVPTTPFVPDALGASNNWVVSGARSSTGKPLLANDPHLGTRAPGVWYLAHIEGGALNAVGATLPGVPGIVIGHNQRIAWGVTNLMADVQDLYIERLNADGAAEYNGAWEPMRVVHEVIRIKGAPDVRIAVRSTRHGPIITDIARGAAEALALRWTALDERDLTLTAFMGVNRAQNWREFQAAMASYHVPIQNWVYADVDGNIGYMAFGALPMRAKGDGTLPVPGWTSEYEWTGYAPLPEMPQIANPTRGYVVTANNQAMPDAYPHVISTNWEPGYRAARITELIDAAPVLSIDTMKAIHADVRSPQVRILLPWMLRTVTNDPRQQAAIERLKAWDGALGRDSPSAAIYMAWYDALVEALFRDDLGDTLWLDWAGLPHWPAKALHGIVMRTDDRWCDDRRTPAAETCETVLATSLDAALKALDERTGTSSEDAWRWGALNEVVFPHVPFEAHPLLRRFFSHRAELGGSPSTVTPVMRSEAQTVVASYRQILDLADFDRSQVVLTLGQSGQVGSPHVDDMLGLWQATAYAPLPFSRTAVDAAARYRLSILP